MTLIQDWTSWAAIGGTGGMLTIGVKAVVDLVRERRTGTREAAVMPLDVKARRLQIAAQGADLAADVEERLREMFGRMDELRERLAGAERAMARAELRAERAEAKADQAQEDLDRERFLRRQLETQLSKALGRIAELERDNPPRVGG